MKSIPVDSEVYEFIKNNAEPFVDSPNSVLRRLLLGEKQEKSGHIQPLANSTKQAHATANKTPGGSTKFVHRFLASKFEGKFVIHPPYRMMFESKTQIIYFQNFNKQGTLNLWYRLKSNPMKVLRSSEKEAFVCLTNPAEEYGFVLPLQEIEKHIKASGWEREELEINIDPADSRYRELSWNLEPYLHQLS